MQKFCCFKGLDTLSSDHMEPSDSAVQISMVSNILKQRICMSSDLKQTSVKYLGVDLDESLSGETIATKAVAKINNKIKFLYRNTKSFNLDTKKLLVSALIQCHFGLRFIIVVFWFNPKTQIQIAGHSKQSDPIPFEPNSKNSYWSKRVQKSKHGPSRFTS